MKFSILCPTRERPERIKKLLFSIVKTVKDYSNIEILFRVDTDDKTVLQLLDIIKDNWPFEIKLIIKPNTFPTMAWNELFLLSAGDILGIWDDDCIFYERDWMKDFEEEFSFFPNRLGLVYCDEGIQHEKLASFPFISKSFADILGYTYPGRFIVGYEDIWLHQLAVELKRIRYIPKKLFLHEHITKNISLEDATYKEAENKRKQINMKEYYKSLSPTLKLEKIFINSFL